MNNAPIGVFDSGMGGLSVWGELYKGLPNESMIYYGEGKNCPFGSKTQEQIISYADYAVGRLLEKGAKMVVLACNAATAMSVDYLRGKYAVPFVGLEPAVRPAALSSKTGIIGVLATAATLEGRHFRETSARYADRVKIISAVGEGFVELVENNMEQTPEAIETVARAMKVMIDAGADMIVLGCTHYPFLEDALKKAAGGKDITFIDPSAAVGHRVDALLDEYSLRAASDNEPFYEFMTSADENYRQRLRSRAERIMKNTSSSK